MTAGKRVRRVFSVKEELLKKSREAALAAVQVFNNPNITFKSETYVVLMIIAWTYLLHAYYRKQKVDYRYYANVGSRKRYDRTKHGALKFWELERCLSEESCPLAKDVCANLRFLIGLRHEIEHQMTTRIDDLLSARLQACCINYHEALVSLFGVKYGIADDLALALQFSALTREQVDAISKHPALPGHIRKYIEGFDGALPAEQFGSEKFAYRVIFVPKLVNHPNQADQVITFAKADSALAKGINEAYVTIKETEKPKYLPSMIVTKMRQEGYASFNISQHTWLWQNKNAKARPGFGIQIAKTWYWYDAWVEIVRAHCKAATNAE
jgi:hypothetical protein